MLAPVRWLKSGARRCSGSAICGPVKVRTVTSTPLNWSAPVPCRRLALVVATATAAAGGEQQRHGGDACGPTGALTLGHGDLPCVWGRRSAHPAPPPWSRTVADRNIGCLGPISQRRGRYSRWSAGGWRTAAGRRWRRRGAPRAGGSARRTSSRSTTSTSEAGGQQLPVLAQDGRLGGVVGPHDRRRLQRHRRHHRVQDLGDRHPSGGEVQADPPGAGRGGGDVGEVAVGDQQLGAVAGLGQRAEDLRVDEPGCGASSPPWGRRGDGARAAGGTPAGRWRRTPGRARPCSRPDPPPAPRSAAATTSP